jgi:hypothetical protein
LTLGKESTDSDHRKKWTFFLPFRLEAKNVSSKYPYVTEHGDEFP